MKYALAVALCLLAAACGSSSTSTSVPRTNAPTNVTITPMGNMLKFATDSFTMGTGTDTITFVNNSHLPHNFTLANSSGKVLAATPTFRSGSHAIIVTLRAGTYTYYCSVPGHKDAGMHGILTVN